MIYTTHGAMTPADWAEYRLDYDWNEPAQPEPGDEAGGAAPHQWIDSKRECSCSVWDGWPDPSCDLHGMDAHYGRFDSCWWGRIRLPHVARGGAS